MDPKKLSNKEGPWEYTWIFLRKRNKIDIGNGWSEGDRSLYSYFIWRNQVNMFDFTVCFLLNVPLWGNFFFHVIILTYFFLTFCLQGLCKEKRIYFVQKCSLGIILVLNIMNSLLLLMSQVISSELRYSAETDSQFSGWILKTIHSNYFQGKALNWLLEETVVFIPAV